MTKKDNNLAIVIELQGEMKDKAMLAWEKLARDFSVDYIPSMSVAPHITICSGFKGDPVLISEILNNLAMQLRSFSIQGNGLGVFVADTPVVHVRWTLNDEILNFIKTINNTLLEASRSNAVKGYNHDKNWVAKTTLAYNDTDYNNLCPVLNMLRTMDFNCNMIINTFSLYEYSLLEGEKNIAQFELQA